jgi:hypothetical protein
VFGQNIGFAPSEFSRLSDSIRAHQFFAALARAFVLSCDAAQAGGVTALSAVMRRMSSPRLGDASD